MSIDQLNRIICCPICKKLGDVQQYDQNMRNQTIEGTAYCGGGCIVREPVPFDPRRVFSPNQDYSPNSVDYLTKPLDFEFSCCMFSNRVRTQSRWDDNEIYEYPIRELGTMPTDFSYSATRRRRTTTPTKPQIYAVTCGEGSDFHLVLVTSNATMAENVASKFDYGKAKVESYDCPNLPSTTEPFKVFVVSVGEGPAYRIVDIFVDKKRAYKVSTSLRGAVSTLDAMPSETNTKDVRYYKYFVTLESHTIEFGCEDEDCDCDGGREGSAGESYYVDCFTRRETLYASQNPAPMVTRRRRYNSSLPYRFEVAATSKAVASDIAESMIEQIKAGKVKLDEYEFNVDYPMIADRNDWTVDNSLLV